MEEACFLLYELTNQSSLILKFPKMGLSHGTVTMEMASTEKGRNNIKLNLAHSPEQSSLAVCSNFLVLEGASHTSQVINF